eukprot:337548-Rhodomonas_salina.1
MCDAATRRTNRAEPEVPLPCKTISERPPFKLQPESPAMCLLAPDVAACAYNCLPPIWPREAQYSRCVHGVATRCPIPTAAVPFLTARAHMWRVQPRLSWRAAKVQRHCAGRDRRQDQRQHGVPQEPRNRDTTRGLFGGP